MNRRNFLVGIGLSSIGTALNMRARAASQTGNEVSAEEMVDLLYVRTG